MVFSRKYSRNFISLNQESSAYNLDFRACMGRCIIEIKNNEGKINISVQGLKSEVLYKICLLSVQSNFLKETCMGFINIDDNGKGESKLSFNPNNINNSGLKIEDCNVIALIVEREREIISPLVGYIGEEISWKDKYMYNLNKNQASSNTSNNEANNQTTPEPQQALTEYERGKLEEAKGQLEYEKGKIDEARGELEYRKGKLDEASGRLEYEKGKLDEASGRLEYEKGKLDETSGDFDYEKGKIDEASGELEYRKGKLDEASGRLEYEKGKLDEASGRLEYEKGKLDEKQGILDYLAGKKEEEFWKNQNNQGDATSSNNGSLNSSAVNLEKTKNTAEDRYESFNKLIENFKKEMLNLEEVLKENKTENLDKDNTNNAVNSKNLDIEYIKMNNPVMKPFENQDKDTVWYRISPEDLTILGKDSWKYINNQFVFANFKKYRHLMLGIKKLNDEENYILAIPCKFDTNFVASGELAEFNNFVSLSKNMNVKSLNGVYGYRLIRII